MADQVDEERDRRIARVRRKARSAQERRELEAARRLFREELPAGLQRELTVELARTRGAERSLAF